MRHPFLIPLLLAVAWACSPVTARAEAPDLPMQLLERGLSHLVPHIFPHLAASPDSAELPPVPDSLLEPLRADGEDVIKGLNPEDERLMAAALLALPLRQRVLKVAVAGANDKRLGLIKLQAGDFESRRFRLDDLQDDAVSALRVAFALPLDLDEVDLWSVIPERNGKDSVHRPVFSVAANRRPFLAACNAPKASKDILGELGLVRFAPEYLRYAGGEELQAVAAQLPRTAYSVRPLADSWEQLTKASSSDPRLSEASVARVVVRIPVSDNSVGLTIDDGPHPLITSLFLETLRQYRVKATFFVVGEKVEECPELLRRLAEDGHELGNHTYSHPRLAHVSPVEALTQIRACGEVVGRVCGQRMHLLRPPGGGISAQVLRAATAANCSVILWTHNTNDWLKPSAEEIAENALRDLRPGDIILMHQGEAESARALAYILEGLEARGLRPATIGEMLAQAPVPAQPISDIMTLYAKHELGME
ncbi:MAG: polysaccharide deacetylase family protein [Armatimonadetes bacterium]|nr:polysaccharide deacetylase family protein [Armatimonadota bacterium]